MKSFRYFFSMLTIFCVCFSLFYVVGCQSDDDDDDDEQFSSLNLNSEQYISDFQHLVHMFNKYYGPMEWKTELFGTDILSTVHEYEDRINNASNDLAYFDIMFDFVSQFQDGHSTYTIPSTYAAFLGFDVDLYEGKLIVDAIYNPSLPLEIGDEIVTFDDTSAADLVAGFTRYFPGGFDLCVNRWSTTLVTNRVQALCPYVPQSAEAVLTIRHLDGSTETLSLPWTFVGTEYTPGYYEDPFSKAGQELDIMERLDRIVLDGPRGDFLMNTGKYGHRDPSFQLPDSFVQRLGTGASDEYFSGIYTVGQYQIGFIRIPKMWVDQQSSYAVFNQEIAAFKELTDGLIIDIIDNPGGSTTTCQNYAQRLHTEAFTTVKFKYRPTLAIINDLESYLYLSGLSPDTREFITNILAEFRDTYQSDQLLTDPVSMSSNNADGIFYPLTDTNGDPIGYDKPIIILINELSISGGDFFPAILQDSGRAKCLGVRTSGAGGHVVDYDFEMPYSEASIRITGSLMYRPQEVQPDGYPATHYIENVGIHPDIYYDYQNMDDLLNNGANYVSFFTDKIIEEIEAQ